MATVEIITARGSQSEGSRRVLGLLSGKGMIQTRASTAVAVATIARVLIIGLDGCVILRRG
jgi:hypothetical protein